jgi:asparagine synthase (glutamine-hydrolysing)
MSGLCGWFGGGERGDAAQALARMVSGVPVVGQPAGQSRIAGDLGLAIVSAAKTGWMVATEQGACAIQGYPVWREARAAETARLHGHAVALLEAYRDFGERLFDRLMGPFSLAILDPKQGRAMIAIDRFGVETMCWGLSGDGALVFGTTADAVRAHPGIRASLSAQSLFEFLYFVDRVPAPRTIYAELRKLAPGEYLSFERGRATVNRYWAMPYDTTVRVDKREAAAELKRLLRASVAASVAGEEPQRLGTFLSGGLDSSTVTGLASELVPGIKSFTIGFPVEGFDESRYAEIAAQRFHTTQRTYPMAPEKVMDVVRRCITIYDEPFANSSAVPSYCCADLARASGVELILAGDGGDELFAGNERYVSDRIFDPYSAIPGILRRAIIEPIADARFIDSLPIIRKAARYSRWGRLSVAERVTKNVYWSVGASQIFTDKVLREIDLEAPRALMSEIYDAATRADKVQRMMNYDLRITLADSDLRKVSRMCALAGLRVRYPFLDEDVATFSATLPQGLLLEGGELRAFYKEAMVGFLPTEILEKQKHGFGLPYFEFVTAHPPLRELACEAMTQLKARELLRPEFLDGIVTRMRNGAAAPYDGVTWDLLVLELWLQSRV